MEEAYNKAIENGADEQEIKQKIAHVLVEIEEAINIGFMVQDKDDSDNVYIVTKDMKEGENISVPKDVIAELYAEENDMYEEWEKEFNEYKEKRKEAEKKVSLPKNFLLGRFRRKPDNQ